MLWKLNISIFYGIQFFFPLLGIKCSTTVAIFSFGPFDILFKAHNLQKYVFKQTHNIDLIQNHTHIRNSIITVILVVI